MGERYWLKQKNLKCIARVHEILSQDNPPKMTTAKLAKEVGINRNKLQQGFKEVYGCTIRDFRKRKRMEQAKKLLTTTGETVVTIGTMMGYAGNSPFTTAFKRKYGIPPGQFRKQVESERMKDMINNLRMADGA
jgi:AraC-like DNA-binding protein